jgi:NAD(P)-dependent dehydrogenase (short-subunit alcohol dehydrogenase family)
MAQRFGGRAVAEGKLTGRVALVTGAGSGIGLATARRMAAEGARVLLTGIPEGLVTDAADKLRGAGYDVAAHVADVSDEAQTADAVLAARDRFGSLDILVPNAGVQMHATDRELHELPSDVWDATHDVNYPGVYLTVKHGLAQFVRQGTGGVVIIVASITGLNGASANPAYMSGKHGVLGLSRHVAVHYAAHGIRCNAVCPGALDRTPNHDIHPDPRGREERLEEAIPLGRLGRPDDIAPLITFLATDDASYATGGTFVVDGGLTVT